MRRTILLLVTTTLTLLVASGVVLAAAIGSAGAQSSVVGPGQSIQKAVNAADPGDTIVVRGVHREDVIIRKNGIKLRGDDAVIEAPTRGKADSLCSKVTGPEAICIIGDVNLDTGELTGPRVRDVSVSGFTIRGFKIKRGRVEGSKPRVIDIYAARNATVVGNRAIGNVPGGIVAGRSVNTTIANNHVIGSPETIADGILVEGSSRTTVVKNVIRRIPEEGQNGIQVVEGIDTTIAGNDLIGNFIGVLDENSTETKILSNHISRSGATGIVIFGRKHADAKVVGNNISGGAWGTFIVDTHRGTFAGNTIYNNCAGMSFVAFPSTPVGEFEVKGNTVENNTRSCRAAQFGITFSGIGIGLFGASGMELTGNHLSGNVPSGPTRISGGAVVATDPYGDGAPKPMNNSVTGNHFGRNKPDIFWDESGSGNRFLGNLCDTSVPSSLCN
jgi:parallel beta-helix repeat protein